MRGTHSYGLDEELHHGIIPAYAGNTTAKNASTKANRDHPRVCGEHHVTVHAVVGGEGSSPRMRGTRVAAHDNANPIGIIPAYAGNTRHSAIDSECRQDHPRVCGEHALAGNMSV